MDIHGYPRKNDMDMDMDMDGIFLIHGKPGLYNIEIISIYTYVSTDIVYHKHNNCIDRSSNMLNLNLFQLDVLYKYNIFN